MYPDLLKSWTWLLLIIFLQNVIIIAIKMTNLLGFYFLPLLWVFKLLSLLFITFWFILISFFFSWNQFSLHFQEDLQRLLTLKTNYWSLREKGMVNVSELSAHLWPSQQWPEVGFTYANMTEGCLILKFSEK